MGYTYRRRRNGPGRGAVLSVILLAVAVAYLAPQYLAPRVSSSAPATGTSGTPASQISAPTSALVQPPIDLSGADKLLLEGKWDAAADLYLRASERAPGDASIQARLARSLVFGDRASESLPFALRSVELDSQSAFNQTVLALVFNWLGNTERALTAARRATELDPRLPEAQAYLAEAYTDRYQLQEADLALKKAGEAGGGDNPEVLREQAYLLETRADYAGAIDTYQRAISVAPTYSYLYVSLGQALRAAKRPAEAVVAFSRAIDLNPRDARAEAGLGTVYYASADYASAQSHLERAIEINPTYATAYGQLGWVFYVQKRYDRAEPAFLRAVDLEKDATRSAAYRHALGWIYVNAKQWDRAREQFQKALEGDANLAGARDGLAEVQKQTGQTPTP